jgi:hypothetical protein
MAHPTPTTIAALKGTTNDCRGARAGWLAWSDGVTAFVTAGGVGSSLLVSGNVLSSGATRR